MKKSFFYLTAGLMAISACTSQKVLDEGVKSNAIGFQSVVSNQTKADGDFIDEINTGNINEFGVFGYYTHDNDETHGILVFNNEKVSKDQNGKWGYENTRYWVPGANYYFYAYCCGGTKLSEDYGSFAINVNASAKEDRVLTITGYKCDNSHQHDLLYASKEVVGPANNETATNVSFNFSHILTKVDAIFSSKLPADYIVKISDVQISGTKLQGNYNPYNGWHNLAETTSHVVLQGESHKDNNYKGILEARNSGTYFTVDGNGVVTENELKDPVTPKSGYAYVIPNNYKEANNEVTLSFKVQVCKIKEVKEGEEIKIDTDEVVLARNLSATWGPEWKTGYKYTYTIELNGDAAGLKEIVFGEITVKDWEAEETVNGNDGEGDNNKFVIEVK